MNSDQIIDLRLFQKSMIWFILYLIKSKDRFFEEKKEEIEKIKVENLLSDEIEYEIFTNCMDSSLYFKDEDINDLCQKWYSEFND